MHSRHSQSSQPPTPTPTNRSQAPINNSASSPDVACAAFALLEQLDSGRRRPPPSISKVFRLYCIDLLSASQVARQCHCSKSAVIRRLNYIRKKTGLPINDLRIHYPRPGSIDGLPADTCTYVKNNKTYRYVEFPSFAE